jgi:hypothetical protein
MENVIDKRTDYIIAITPIQTDPQTNRIAEKINVVSHVEAFFETIDNPKTRALQFLRGGKIVPQTVKYNIVSRNDTSHVATA